MLRKKKVAVEEESVDHKGHYPLGTMNIFVVTVYPRGSSGLNLISIQGQRSGTKSEHGFLQVDLDTVDLW